MREWVQGINRSNLVVDSAERDVAIIGKQLSAANGTEFVVLTAAEVESLIEKVDSLPLASAPYGIRPTPGLLLRADGGSVGTADRHVSTLGSLVPISPIALAALKRDIEDGAGRLDRTRRQGGWGALAVLAGRQYGERWTARSLGTVRGVADRSRPTSKSTVRVDSIATSGR